VKKAWFMLAAMAAAGACVAGDSMDLSGRWRFALDRQDAGLREGWQDRELSDTLRLPGSLPGQGIGDPVTTDTRWTGEIVDRSFFVAPEYEKYRQPGNVKIPFWLQPETQYVGAAWYARDVDIPKSWADKRVELFIERPHWETRVWVDGQPVGTNNALGTPHVHDLGRLMPGRHRLTVRVDNRMVVNVGPNSHSVTDHTQGNWNGMVGRLELRARPLVWIEEVQVFPDVTGRKAVVRVAIGNATGRDGRGELRVGSKKIDVSWSASGGMAETTLDMSRAKLWDEFAPNLTDLTVRLGDDQRMVRFGMREIATRGTQFTINGRPVFFRGTLECCISPKTGHPPTDVAEWKRIIGVAKAHGLNMIRFHSWCPPEAAFVAADELGFYLQVECSSWANSTTGLGQGRPVDPWLYEEADRILKFLGNHPSFVLMQYGNEPGGNHVPYLAKWVNHYKARDPRRLYAGGAGWPQLAEDQFHVPPDPRIQGWGQGLRSRINANPPETCTDYAGYMGQRKVPVISHEIGQWCVYPNFDEMKKYTGYLKPRNFEIFRDRLAEHGMLDQARDFLLASGKLQALCYKEEIESALRTPGMGGFQLLDLHDFPGQGTALVGVLDPFWEEKGYITAKEYSRFCNSTVLLARLKKRVFTTDELFEADVEVAHFGPAPLEKAVAEWKLITDDGKTIASGILPATHIPVANGVKLGPVIADLNAAPVPVRCKFVVGLKGTRFENDWDVWVYPPQVDTEPPADVKIVTELDADTISAGGKLLWLVPPKRVKNARTNPVIMGFSSIFWNTAWTRRQAPTTLGILCDPKHPAFADFPTDFHSNWQWWHLVTRAAPMILDELPASFRPTVQVIDDWFTARKLGLMFEANIGKAEVVVCSIALDDDNPVVRQFRHSLLQYMAGDSFAPSQTLELSAVQRLFTPAARIRSVRADSEAPGFEAANAFDGDPDTMWHTPWDEKAPAFPHELIVEFPKAVNLAGITCLPRQDGNRNGWIKEWAVHVSADGRDWGAPVATGAFTCNADLQTVRFARPVETRFLKLAALAGFDAEKPFASLAELNVITGE
jgi:hypothetical protein